MGFDQDVIDGLVGEDDDSNEGEEKLLRFGENVDSD